MLTIGHSTLPVEVFLRILRENSVATLIDIRTIPKSRFNPQFAQEALADSLESAGIAYRWSKDLGGLRPPRADSVNTGWRNKSFRGYADYMQTPQFVAALDRLIHGSSLEHTVVMCAEAVPWRCHRSLVADALLVRDVPVEDILCDKSGGSQRRTHMLTPFAKTEGTRLWYPRPEVEMPLFGQQ